MSFPIGASRFAPDFLKSAYGFSRIIAFQIAPQGSGTPQFFSNGALSPAVPLVASVARTGVGALTVTLQSPWKQLISAQASMNAANIPTNTQAHQFFATGNAQVELLAGPQFPGAVGNLLTYSVTGQAGSAQATAAFSPTGATGALVLYNYGVSVATSNATAAVAAWQSAIPAGMVQFLAPLSGSVGVSGSTGGIPTNAYGTNISFVGGGPTSASAFVATGNAEVEFLAGPLFPGALGNSIVINFTGQAGTASAAAQWSQATAGWLNVYNYGVSVATSNATAAAAQWQAQIPSGMIQFSAPLSGSPGVSGSTGGIPTSAYGQYQLSGGGNNPYDVQLGVIDVVNAKTIQLVTVNALTGAPIDIPAAAGNYINIELFVKQQ